MQTGYATAEFVELDEYGQILASSIIMRSRLVVSSLFAGGCAALGLSGGASNATSAPALSESLSPSPAAGDSMLWIAMREVNLHIDDEHVMHVRDLRGQVIANRAATVPFLDDPGSFRIRVTSGTVDLTGPDLAALLNGFVSRTRARRSETFAVASRAGRSFHGIMHRASTFRSR
jgi:hypothetical protein